MTWQTLYLLNTIRNGKPITGRRCCVGLWCGVSN